MNTKINNKSFLIGLLLLVCNMPLYAVYCYEEDELQNTHERLIFTRTTKPSEKYQESNPNNGSETDNSITPPPKGVIDVNGVSQLSLKVRKQWLYACSQQNAILHINDLYETYGERIVNCADNKGVTGLMVAAYYGYTANFQFLLSLGADIRMRDTDGDHVLVWLNTNHSKKTTNDVMSIRSLISQEKKRLARIKKRSVAPNKLYERRYREIIQEKEIKEKKEREAFRKKLLSNAEEDAEYNKFINQMKKEEQLEKSLGVALLAGAACLLAVIFLKR